MIIVEVTGGLGNQMFQYALYRKLQLSGKDVKLDLSFYQTKQSLRALELGIFRLPLRAAGKREICRLKGYTNDASRVEKALTTRIYRHPYVYKEDLDKGYQEVALQKDPVYLTGYWQNELYFKDIRGQLLNDFKFPQPVINTNQEILHRLQQDSSVSVHVRRGDYLDSGNVGIYGGICTLEYYRKAMDYIRNHMENPQFYIFTDDPQWVKQNLYQEGMYIVRHTDGDPDYVDMFLMSQCTAHIIANSTFSWWGAWLDPKENKMVISPDRWLNNHNVNNAICDWFITIESQEVQE